MTLDHQSGEKPRRSRRRPATTPEGRESQLTALAYDCAEQQMRDGTASSQIIAHFLKAGSTRDQLELERLRHENDLLVAKREAIESQARSEELYANALDAMRRYSGSDPS